MPQLPVLSAREVIAGFEHFGWKVARPGNHIIMVKPGHPAALSVPNHKPVARGTLRSLIRASGIDIDDFIRAVG